MVVGGWVIFICFMVLFVCLFVFCYCCFVCLFFTHENNQQTKELISARTTSRKHKQQRPESPTVTVTWHAGK